MGNVFIVDGVVKLGDSSSLVKLLSQISAHNRFAHTHGWRAPRQVYSVFRIKVVKRGMESHIDILTSKPNVMPTNRGNN